MYESYIQTIFILCFRLLCGLLSIVNRHLSGFLSYDDTLSVFDLVKCFYSFLRLFHIPLDRSLVLNSNKSKDGIALRSVCYNIFVYCFVLTLLLEQQLSEDYVCLIPPGISLWPENWSRQNDTDSCICFFFFFDLFMNQWKCKLLTF